MSRRRGQGCEELHLRARRHRDERPGLGGEGRHGRREARARDPRARLTGEQPREGAGHALDEDRLGTPQALQPVDLGLEEAKCDVGRVGGPGDRRAEPA